MRSELAPLILALFLLVSGCSNDPHEKEKELLRVNDFAISQDEVDSRLKFEAGLKSNFYLSQDMRTEFVKDLIQSQLLIQEAKKQKFDQSEMFRQTIQRYWESTLIRDLLAEKGEQLRKTTVVTAEQIDRYINDYKEFLPDSISEEMRKELAKKIEDQIVNEKMAAWLEELKSQARIDIKDPDLAAKVNRIDNDG